MEHIKGPWKIKFEFNVEDTNGRTIASCGGYSDNCRVQEVDAENKANARLIAAAPDLLEALRPFAQFACGCGECHNCIAQAAIAKAEIKS